MPAVITEVERESPAARAGVLVGDRLLRIGEHAISDVLDLMFYAYDAELTLTVAREGAEHSLPVHKREGEPLGLTFGDYLMDRPRRCSNNCVFCFVDQMPPGLRDTLYFKDDDARLSFLQGNYISMTNLSEADVERMVRMRISPINISVHTTSPTLRDTMLGNPRGGSSLCFLRRFADAGITMGGQIVLCPGLNDGEELDRTLHDLAALHPAMESVSVVPVGLSRHRDGLYPLRPVDAAKAAEVIDQVDGFGEQMLRRHGLRLFYCADELYLTAGRPLPPYEYYDGFPQLENGVGMATLFLDEFEQRLEKTDPAAVCSPFLLITGKLFEPLLQGALHRLQARCPGVRGEVRAITNRFFGESITVSGLITGRDIIEQLCRAALPERVMIPVNMLRSGERVFLDDVTVEQVEAALGVRVIISDSGGDALIGAILSESPPRLGA